MDDITFGCTADGCAGTMRRTPEVIDCWFDSGSMPFAQYHYPFENKELFESQFPADFISEGIDQTRGWFYTMLVISTFLTGTQQLQELPGERADPGQEGQEDVQERGQHRRPHGDHAHRGRRPAALVHDHLQPGLDAHPFDREGVKEAQRKLLATLENTYNFFTALRQPGRLRRPIRRPRPEPDLLDRWILSRLQSVTGSVTGDLEALNLTRAAKTLGTFVMDDVSNWYVRLSRRRFWKGEMTAGQAHRLHHPVHGAGDEPAPAGARSSPSPPRRSTAA